MNAHCKFECPHCGELYDYRHQAQSCCPQPEIWFCICGARHSNEQAAEECCRGKS